MPLLLVAKLSSICLEPDAAMLSLLVEALTFISAGSCPMTAVGTTPGTCKVILLDNLVRLVGEGGADVVFLRAVHDSPDMLDVIDV